jgi:hypothetical protein
MIVYDLVCGRQHRFEGWFGSADDFARQRDEALIRCPMCDDASIQRRPSANILVGRTPDLPRTAEAERKETATPAEPKDAPAERKELPVANVDAKMLAVLRKLVAETENVGRGFPEEARKIHYEEAPKRGIRGQATSEEAEELRDEGIEFMSLPNFLTRDLN